MRIDLADRNEITNVYQGPFVIILFDTQTQGQIYSLYSPNLSASQLKGVDIFSGHTTSFSSFHFFGKERGHLSYVQNVDVIFINFFNLECVLHY